MIEDEYTIEGVVYIDGGSDLAMDARARYSSVFPGRSSRRMTHLGMLITMCLSKLKVSKETPVIYASAYGESETLERFIDSFPAASPAAFQSSIHPSAVEQALIPGKQVIDRFYPITCGPDLVGKGLECCFVLGEAEVILLGGEERGDWLCAHNLASHDSFAFGLQLSHQKEGLGKVKLGALLSEDEESSLGLASFAQALGERRSIRIPAYGLNRWIEIDWR